MSSLPTFCAMAVSTAFDAQNASSSVSLDWVLNSGIRTHNSQVSGVLVLPSNVGAISMALKNIPVVGSLASDLLLGLDWFNFVMSNAHEFVVYLDNGVSLDLRQPTLMTNNILQSSADTPTAASMSSPSSSSVPFLGPGAVLGARGARTPGVQSSETRRITHDDIIPDEPSPASIHDDPFVLLNLNEKN
ncbi:hypothetical protein C8F04DRAFT_1396799, partial [Mycena alexandri]